MRPALVALLMLAALVVFAGCGRHAGGAPTPVTRPLAAGEAFGRVDRASAGTPQATVRTLLSVECKDGRLTVRTNADAIIAANDCATPVPQSTLDQLLGMPAVVTYTGDRLVIENAAKTVRLELPARNAAVGAIHGAP